MQKAGIKLESDFIGGRFIGQVELKQRMTLTDGIVQRCPITSNKNIDKSKETNLKKAFDKAGIRVSVTTHDVTMTIEG